MLLKYKHYQYGTDEIGDIKVNQWKYGNGAG
jgi:hypothetical protein